MAREGVPLIVIHRQLGHTNLGISSIYLRGIDSNEIIDTVHARRPPDGPGRRNASPLTAKRRAAAHRRLRHSTVAEGSAAPLKRGSAVSTPGKVEHAPRGSSSD
jgi:hypothetical protein